MQEVLIFSGTSEGRKLAEILCNHKISVTVCVATEYGQEIMKQNHSKYLSVQMGRINEREIEMLIRQKDWQAIVDATHPFAKEVTKNIRQACEKQSRKSLRLLRDMEEDDNFEKDNVFFVPSTSEAIECLNQTSGIIFLTTGSKELAEYMAGVQDTSRIYVRILPISDEIEKCRSLGLQGKQMICMQGPFSVALNTALMQEIQASVLVTKETGKAGGFQEKLAAAKNVGAKTIVIRCPKEKGYSLEEILQELGVNRLERLSDICVKKNSKMEEFSDTQELCISSDIIEKDFKIEEFSDTQELCISSDIIEKDFKIKEFPDVQNILSPSKIMETDFKERTISSQKVPQITIAGIGMGSLSNMTREVFYACTNADIIIGAKRVLETIKSLKKPIKNLYKSQEIVDFILEHPQYQKIVVLMSGDVGCYSGAKGLLQALQKAGNFQVQLLCGISSVVYLAARLQIPWEDMALMSTHGRQQNIIGKLNICEKVFVLTEGAKNVRKLSYELLQYGFDKVKMYVGCQLSYPEEEIFSGNPEQFLDFEKEGIMAVLLIHENGRKTVLSQGISDTLFVRGKVPMTKEEVRSISLAKLALRQDSVAYDIGSGTGSIAVECAKIAINGKIYAIEKKKEALELIEKNKFQHKVWNLEIIAGEAPEVLEGLEPPTHAFIGGSNGRLQEILKVLWKQFPKVRVVLNILSLETIREVMELLKEHEFVQQEIVQVAISKAKKLGEHHLMMGQNPIYVITLQK